MIATYPIKEIRKALQMKRRTGKYPALDGWSLLGKKIKIVEFKTHDRVILYGESDEIIAAWSNGNVCLDD
jgi:hypothetical protein